MQNNNLNLGNTIQYFQILNYFKNNYLKNSPKYERLIEETDSLYEKIYNAVMEDEQKNKVVDYIMNNFIIPIIKEIEKLNFDQSAKHYILFLNTLMAYYNLEEYDKEKVKKYE